MRFFYSVAMNQEIEKEFASGKVLPVCETFYSLQGEGANAGAAAFFIRLAGCNVRCDFCDSKSSWDVSAAKRLSVEDLAERIKQSGARNVVITGGEPLLYNLNPLCDHLHAEGLSVWLETSGTCPLRGTFDWVCVSPKKKLPPLKEVLAAADEVKIVIASKEDFSALGSYENECPIHGDECPKEFHERGIRASETAIQNTLSPKRLHLCLQPEWNSRKEITPLIIDYIKSNPAWHLSLQTHKYLGIE